MNGYQIHKFDASPWEKIAFGNHFSRWKAKLFISFHFSEPVWKIRVQIIC